MKLYTILFTLILSSCASNIPELDTERYTNRLAMIKMNCQRRQIKFITLMDNATEDLNQCKFVSSVRKHGSLNEDPCPELFQHLLKDGENKVVLAPAESPFVMELRDIEKVEVYKCPSPLYKAFLETEKHLRKL